jgi:radical SAM superfamily enzyme YgiQ (UPF0313 family)
MRKVLFVELTAYESTLPLVAGYLEAFASMNQEIIRHYAFEKYTKGVNDYKKENTEYVIAKEADIYAFSCYSWNMALIKHVVAELLSNCPESRIILGGPQVANHAKNYLTPSMANRVFICNSEGELVFSEFLLVDLEDKPLYEKIPGLSFLSNDRIITSPAPGLIGNIDSIPSPYLNDTLKVDGYETVIIETSRGCPYECSFCYWGGDEVYREFSITRVLNEIEYIASRKCQSLYIIDSNFGIHKRDIDIVKHIVECKKKYGCFQQVFFASAKNIPDRVLEIAKILKSADILTPISIAFQSFSIKALEYAHRRNISNEHYLKLQSDLDKNGIGSFIELIWPLPGETLDSLKDGIDMLCTMQPYTVLIYSLMILNNTRYEKERKKYGIKTIHKEDVAEEEIVIATNEVSEDEYNKGLDLFHALFMLFTLGGLRVTLIYLQKYLSIKPTDVLDRFIIFINENYANSGIIKERNILKTEYSFNKMHNIGSIVHNFLYAFRKEGDEIIYSFFKSTSWFSENNVRACYEIDVLNKPYIYKNINIDLKYDFKCLEIIKIDKNRLRVKASASYSKYIYEIIKKQPKDTYDETIFTVNYLKKQLPFIFFTKYGYLRYCYDIISMISNIMPDWNDDNQEQNLLLF